jgi:hypothetical protein
VPADIGGRGINAEGSLLGFSITLAAVSFEVFSAHCSSPWTSESFGGNPEKAASARRYVRRSIVVTEVIGAGGTLLSNSWLPFAATTLVCAYMWWTYEAALKKAAESGSTSWS